MREVGGKLVLQIVQVLSEEGWGFFKDTRHLLSCCVNQDHLRYVHDIRLVWLFREIAFVDLECFEINAAH